MGHGLTAAEGKDYPAAGAVQALLGTALVGLVLRVERRRAF
jgi:hypothetical protein